LVLTLAAGFTRTSFPSKKISGRWEKQHFLSQS